MLKASLSTTLLENFLIIVIVKDVEVENISTGSRTDKMIENLTKPKVKKFYEIG